MAQSEPVSPIRLDRKMVRFIDAKDNSSKARLKMIPGDTPTFLKIKIPRRNAEVLPSSLLKLLLRQLSKGILLVLNMITNEPRELSK